MKKIINTLIILAMLYTSAYACEDTWFVRNKNNGMKLCPDGQIKVSVCHKEKTINVSWLGWVNGYQGLGSTLGSCEDKKPVQQTVKLIKPYWMYMTWMIEAHEGTSESYVNKLTNIRDNEVDKYITYDVLAPPNVDWQTLQFVDFISLVDMEKLAETDSTLKYHLDGVAWAKNQAKEWAEAHNVEEARTGLLKYIDMGKFGLNQYYLMNYTKEANEVYNTSLRKK